MKKLSIGIAVVMVVALTASFACAEYVASKASDMYHCTSCASAAKIKAENKVTYKTAMEATKAGLKSCGVCKPPVEDIVASKNSDMCHKESCSYAAKIGAENKKVFGSADEAKKAGMKPCSACKPFGA